MNGSDRADDADEAPDEDRLAAVLVEEALDLLQALLGDVDARAVALEEPAAQPAAEHEAREVAGDGARPDDRDQRDEADLPLAGDDAADDDRRLAGDEQTDERAGLTEREHGDEQVGPGPEGLADVLEDLVEVRQLDHAGAVDRGGDGGDQAADDERRLELVAAPDHDEREHRGGDEPDGLHSGPRQLRAGSSRRARRDRANRPSTVGPEPEISATSAPASRTRSSVVLQIGAQRERRGLRGR